MVFQGSQVKTMPIVINNRADIFLPDVDLHPNLIGLTIAGGIVK